MKKVTLTYTETNSYEVTLNIPDEATEDTVLDYIDLDDVWNAVESGHAEPIDTPDEQCYLTDIRFIEDTK